MTPEQIDTIAEITGLNYCGENCGCGDNSGLFFEDTQDEPHEWLPDWMNGSAPEDVWEWLVESGRLANA